MHILPGRVEVLVQTTMTDFGLSSVKENLSIVSYNCHGFNNGLSYLPVLLDSFDVILLQEHWLSDSELTKLYFSGFVTNAISGFDDSVLLHGRPLGVVPFSIAKTLSVPLSKLKLLLVVSVLS